MTVVAKRVRNIGGTTIRSIGHIARPQRIPDNDAELVAVEDMLSEFLRNENALANLMTTAHSLCDDARDVASASLIENWIDQSQKRGRFLLEWIRSRR